MEKNQKINCTVTSCIHNNGQKQECKLEQIIVNPVLNETSKTPKESECSSYQNSGTTQITKTYGK